MNKYNVQNYPMLSRSRIRYEIIMKLYDKYENNHEHLMNNILLQFLGEW